LDKKIKDDISSRKTNHGQVIKKKNPPVDTLENLAGRKERQGGEALKMWVKLT
jgi:hypothetical protein